MFLPPDLITTANFTRLLAVLLIIVFFCGCRAEETPEKTSSSNTAAGCRACHQVKLDPHHNFPCSNCHRGVPDAPGVEQAHAGLISAPAHPDHAATACGSCHREALAMVADNPHYTLIRHLQTTRLSPTEVEELKLEQVRPRAQPQNPQQLLDDLLRRRCLRCHVYHPGDDYANTSRATGCGACHLSFRNGAMQSHRFLKKPDDQRCLSCHYGNHVGSDYYGRFEHDYNQEYRTPYTTAADVFRPHGIEYHQLTPDIHQRAGLWCIDCHHRDQVMGSTGARSSCGNCHRPESTAESSSVDFFEFISEADGRRYRPPPLRHPAHGRHEGLVSCQVCHARWSYTDIQTHLIRMDHDDFYERERLMLDGSSVTEEVLASHLDWDYHGDILDVVTRDYVTGDHYPGIWLKGFLERRWERFTTVFDGDGILQVARPILDLHLSWVDQTESVRYDNIQPFSPEQAVRPYVPHTIGAAGPFFKRRLEKMHAGDRDETGRAGELK